MKQNIQMLTLVRKDLNLKRDKLLDLIAKSSVQFILENNESFSVNNLIIDLSHEEIIWLNNQKRKFGWKENEESLREVSFRSEINGIPHFKIHDQTLKGINGEGDSLTCVTLGPCDWEEILKVAGKFKFI